VPDHGSIKRTLTIAVVALAAALAACGGIKVKAENSVPQPLVEELPLNAGVYYSTEFRNYAAREERWSTSWQVELGAAHVAAIDRLTKAIFASVTPVSDLGKLPATPLDLILEPRFEEYSFLTPRDSGSEVYAVTIKYRINIYDGQARLIDSLVLTGFGNELAGSLSSSAPLAVATRKAMRDAGAKFAAEFPDQPVVKKLVRHEPVEPIAQGSAAAEGSIGEVQPTATKPVAAPRPAAAAPTAAPSTPAAGSGAAPQAPAAPAVPPAAGSGAAPQAPPAPAVPPAAGETPPAAAPAQKEPAASPAAAPAQKEPSASPAANEAPAAPQTPAAEPEPPAKPEASPTAPTPPAPTAASPAPESTPPPEHPTEPR
jgi:hypothetical protein